MGMRAALLGIHKCIIKCTKKKIAKDGTLEHVWSAKAHFSLHQGCVLKVQFWLDIQRWEVNPPPIGDGHCTLKRTSPYSPTVCSIFVTEIVVGCQ